MGHSKTKLTSLLLSVCLSVSFALDGFRTELQADLDGDGRVDKVRLAPYQAGETTLGQLLVEDSDGKILWQGPKYTDPFDNGAFRFLGEFDHGDLEYLGDYNGDGKIELIATEQKSDVRPTVFKVFQWNGKQFVHVRSAMLAIDPRQPGHHDFYYSFKKADPSESRWVERIEAGKGRQLRFFVSDISRTSRGNFEHVVTWDKKKAKFVFNA